MASHTTQEASPKGRWLFIVIAALGAAVLVALVRGRAAPVQVADGVQSRPVRVIAAPRVDVIPRAVGYGSVRPAHVWQAVAEVSGRIVERNPRLELGAILPKGAVIARIDPTDYQLAVARAEADILAARAQLDQNRVLERNTRDSLAIERAKLELAERELTRRRKLAAQGTLARSTLDQQTRDTLSQRQAVQSLENALRQLPADRQVLQATLARKRNQRETARRDLDRTTLRLPFDARIAKVAVEKTQSVRVGEILVEADSVERAEIEAHIPVQRLRRVISRKTGVVFDPARADLQSSLGLTAEVLLRELGVTWTARFSRFSPTIDPQTRTVGAIVEVDNPYRDAHPPQRPPLIKGMYVEVAIAGRPLPQRLVVPSSALHDDRLYLIDERGRLVIRPVRVDLVQPEFVVIGDGLRQGEQLVVSDLVPAIVGMALAPIDDPAALERLLRVVRTGSK